MFRSLLVLLLVHPWATAALLSSPRAAAILLSSPSAILRHRRTADSCARYVQGASDLDEDAAALLTECNGDVEKARTSYIGYSLAYLEEAMPELYDALKTDPLRPDAHAALVELTWDAIAAFLPVTHETTPTIEAQKRLTAIARAAYDGVGPSPRRFLDVGCGNGLLLPFAIAVGCPPAAYRGIDLSSRMIDMARSAHADPKWSGASFEDTSFGVVADEADAAGSYDAIVLNGSLQFFANLRAVLARASRLLAKTADSRIVIAHISGAEFVRREKKENPMTVLSEMPSLAVLGEVAAELGMLVVTPSFMGQGADEIGRFLDEQFYLVVLRWNAENGGADGEDGVGGIAGA